jgi:ketosteroid isomerase-like protein
MTTAEREVLAANEAFYAAFTNRDYPQLETLWAREHEVAVIHPGWPPLFGRTAVLESWRQIVEGPGAPQISCSDARTLGSGDPVCVVCVEHLPGGLLVATNLFVREAGAWKLVHHQAGPLPPEVPGPTSESVH